MTTSYKDARTHIMKSLGALKILIINEDNLDEREQLINKFEAFHRELAAIDTAALAQSDAEYRALTLRFQSAASDLSSLREKIKEKTDLLNNADDIIKSLTKLAAAL